MDSKKTGISVQETLDRVGAAERRKRMKRLVVLFALFALSVAAVALGGIGQPGEAEMQFHTEAVRQEDLRITVTATGNLEATNEVEVGSELSGTVTSMTADYNDTVSENQPLAYLDNARYQAAVNRYQAELAMAKANHREALAARKAQGNIVTRYKKTRELTKGKLPSLGDLEEAEAKLEQSIAAVSASKAAIQSAEASLQEAESDLAKTIIYAPIGGIVLSRDVEPGQTVAASLEAPVLFTLAEDLHHMELLVDVDEADVGLVKEGQGATFQVDAYADREFNAVITQVRYGAETTDGVVTYKAVLRVENPELLLRPGMTATATITVRKIENSLLVPNTALRFTPARPAGGPKQSRGLLQALMPGPPGKKSGMKNEDPGEKEVQKDSPSVWVLKDGHPVPIPVRKLATDGLSTAITAPSLQAGQQVITHMQSLSS